MKVGDLLLELDPTDLEVGVTQAKAAVAQAVAQLEPEIRRWQSPNVQHSRGGECQLGARFGLSRVSAAERDVEQLTARLTEAEGNARLAETERKRGEELLKGQAIPRADSDRRVNAAETAAADVRAIRQALEAARQKVRQQQAMLGATKSRLSEVRQNAPKQVLTRRASVVSRQANLELARAQLKQAELNLGYTRVVSPVAGIVAKKAVAIGDHVAPGQQLFAIAQTGDLWVTANFRETQIRSMHPGQPAGARRRPRAGPARHGRQLGRRHRLAPQRAPARERHRQLREGGAAHPGAHPARARASPDLERLRPGMSVEPKVKLVP